MESPLVPRRFIDTNAIGLAQCARRQGWRGYDSQGCCNCKARDQGQAAGYSAHCLRLRLVQGKLTSSSSSNAADGGAADAGGRDSILAAARNEARGLVEAGRRDAEEARAAAQSERDAILAVARAEAQEQCAAALQEARAAADSILAAARTEARGLVEAARAEAEQLRERAVAAQAENAAGAAAAGVGSGGRSTLRVFFHGELQEATHNFSADARLGGGGFGGVYRARRLRGFGAAAEFAVKKLDGSSMQGEEEFLQEVQVLGGCCHEHLLRLVGFSANGGEEGRVCLVFPLMQGGSLEDSLFPGAQGREPLGWADRVRVLASVAEALCYLHTPDPATHKPAIMHRDIKPPNILMDADGHVRLADVGLAKMQHADRTHMTLTAVAGTNGFIDPTYVNTGQYDAACDAYSLGITVLMVLSGWRAFEAGQGSIFDRCDEQDAQQVAERAAGWPARAAAEVLRVGLALAEPRKRRRMAVGEALGALRSLAEPGQGLREIVERECVLCMAAPKAVRLRCGHATYCRPCLQYALSRPSPSCPYCRRPVDRDGIAEGDEIGQQDTFVMPVRR